MASRGSEAQRLCKRDQPINAMYGETYIVWVIGCKTPCRKEMLTEKLQIDTEMEMLARGTSASLGVGDDRRVVQRVKLYMCVRGHLTACREKHM